MKKRHYNNYRVMILVLVFVVLALYVFIISRNYFTGFSIMNKIFNPIFILTSVGRLFISINFDINLDSPQNITYNNSLNDSYPISLNISSNRNVTLWNYTLIDLKHNVTLNNSVIFSPNTTIYAKRWSNQLIVTATDHAGNMNNIFVDFFISVNNSAPLIQNISPNIYACEGNYLNYTFNASDVDEDIIIPSLYPQYPHNPFYIMYLSNYNYSLSINEIYSGNLTKNDSGGLNAGARVYQETVYVIDGQYIDSATINITVIETNNAPVIQPISSNTVWTSGDNSSFYYQVIANDSEDGNQSSGNLSFNISFSGASLFNINSSGAMSFSPSSSQIGVYNITICVSDSGLRNPHANISLCGQNGNNLSSCKQFILTVSERSVEISPGGGGGGGSGGGGGGGSGGGGGGKAIACNEKWGCTEWEECQLFDKISDFGADNNSILIIKNMCYYNKWNNSVCGFQKRECNDLNNCTTKISKPSLLKECYYTENPRCDDGIKNCHNGSCEILVDCGGPCQACPSCSDKIQNQGEEGIDCGGPCRSCLREIPQKVTNYIVYFFIFIFILLLAIIFKLARDYYIKNRELKQKIPGF